VHHHLQERHSGDPHILKVVRVGSPGLSIADSLLLLGIIGIESVTLRINKLDIVVELCYR
jgi:hypothetical protein